MKPETLVAQALHAIDEATGAIVPPIHLTTTFARGEDYQTLGGMVYARDESPGAKQTERVLAALEAGTAALVFSSGGLYGASHLPLAYLEKATGPLKLRHLPTNGGGPAVTAVLGGNVNFFMSPTAIALPHIKAGKVRPLAVSSANRSGRTALNDPCVKWRW